MCNFQDSEALYEIRMQFFHEEQGVGKMAGHLNESAEGW